MVAVRCWFEDGRMENQYKSAWIAWIAWIAWTWQFRKIPFPDECVVSTGSRWAVKVNHVNLAGGRRGDIFQIPTLPATTFALSTQYGNWRMANGWRVCWRVSLGKPYRLARASRDYQIVGLV